jgi:hypothetical protein
MTPGNGGSGPPDKFPQWVDLSNATPGRETATLLGNAYALFWNTYGVWPTAAVAVGDVVYLGAYGCD